MLYIAKLATGINLSNEADISKNYQISNLYSKHIDMFVVRLYAGSPLAQRVLPAAGGPCRSRRDNITCQFNNSSSALICVLNFLGNMCCLVNIPSVSVCYAGHEIMAWNMAWCILAAKSGCALDPENHHQPKTLSGANPSGKTGGTTSAPISRNSLLNIIREGASAMFDAVGTRANHAELSFE